MKNRELQRGIGQLFTIDTGFLPAVEVDETDSHFLMSLDLPGIRKEDLKLEIQDNNLVISGERKSEHEEEEEGGKHYSEFSYGSFVRSFALPLNVDPEKIETEYVDGVLRVALPKSEERDVKRIPIGESKGGLFTKLLGKEKEEKKGKAA